MKEPKTIFLCKECFTCFQEGGLNLNYEPKGILSVLLADKNHPCYITLQDNGKAKIRLTPVDRNNSKYSITYNALKASKHLNTH